MTAPATPIDAKPAEPEEPAAARVERSVPRAGWMVIARKEFADHILSARFFVSAIVGFLAVNLGRNSILGSPAVGGFSKTDHVPRRDLGSSARAGSGTWRVMSTIGCPP